MARVGALLTRATPTRLAQTPGARAGSRPEAVARRGTCQEVQGGREVARESHRVLQLLCRRALLGWRRLCAEAPASGRSGARYEQRSLRRGGARQEQRSLANKCEANGPETRSVQSRDIIRTAVCVLAQTVSAIFHPFERCNRHAAPPGPASRARSRPERAMADGAGRARPAHGDLRRPSEGDEEGQHVGALHCRRGHEDSRRFRK